MNIKLLNQVAESIIKYPNNFNMLNFANGTLIADKHQAPTCGTTACIAGWAIALNDGVINAPTSEDSYDKYCEWTEQVAIKAAELLDIDYNYARELFYVTNWPYSFYQKFKSSSTREEEAIVAYNRIKHFIETGK